MNQYITLVSEGTFEYTIEKSKFLGYAAAVQSVNEAEEYILNIKNKHLTSTHCCFAYKLLDNTKRFNDDKEPQGTAGMPIMDCIEKRGLNNTIVVVVRYFGGIKLGAGGLLRAYAKTASEAINNAKTGIYTKCVLADIKISYSQYDIFKNFLKNIIYEEINTDFGIDIKLSIITRKEEFEKIVEYLKTFKGSNATITGEKFYSL